jgi:4-cresol dehydrogenase (hydroxylating)
MLNKNLNKAIEDWTAAIGAQWVSAPSLPAVGCTFETPHAAPVRLLPADADEIRQCLRIAAEHGVAVYPISTGRNWGYGSAAPTAPAALLQLSRLNRISDYDSVLGTVTLEPGVTQQQLFDYLQAQGSEFWMDVTGSSGACSVLGNSLERGIGHSPYSDHAGQIVRMEVLLADGRIIRTGLGHFRGAKAADTYGSGLGPGLGQLFLQSNLGVVINITINLMPAPEYFQAVYFSVEQESGLGPLVDALRPLRLHGVIRSALHIGNAYRVLSGIQQYPWEAAGGTTPLPHHVLKAFSDAWGFGAWNGSGALYGTRRQVADARRRLQAALKSKVAKLHFMDDAALDRAKRWQRPYRWLTGLDLPAMLKLMEPVHQMMKGKPTDQFLASTYWRTRQAVPVDMDPDRDRCGLIWCAHVAPTRGECAGEMTAIASRILLAHGFEPGMTLTLINERSMDNVVSISYDRDVPGEDQRALACYAELARTLMAAGYFPYRLGNQGMQWLQEHAGRDYVALLQQLKQVFDPRQIISPGRYVPL